MRFRLRLALLATAGICSGCSTVNKQVQTSSAHVGSVAVGQPSPQTSATYNATTLDNSPVHIENVVIDGTGPIPSMAEGVVTAASTAPFETPTTIVESPSAGVASSSEQAFSTTSSALPIVTTATVPPEAAAINAPAHFASTQASEIPSTAPQTVAWSIDLATALEITSGQNPQINFARERIREAYARLDGARVLWLPSLRAGANYHKHEGRIQDVAGTIIETSRNSVFNGFGSQAVGAGSPAVPGVLMSFHLRDSIYQPRIAGQVVGANKQASLAAMNDTLMDTAIAYCDLLEALQLKEIAAETTENAGRLAKLTADYAQAGAGLPADADRAAAEQAFRRIEIQRASEEARVRSVRLARLMSHDPQVVIEPTDPMLAPVDLVDTSSSLSDLVAQGLSNRPELTEHRYLVGEAVERLRRERVAPLVPSVLLGLSYGGNGGGLGSSFQNYGDRMDFDAAAFWEIRNFGAGERAARCEAESRVRQARYRQVYILDKVAAEVVEAYTEVDATRAQLPLAESAIAAAADSLRRNQERILNGQGLPIETLQAIVALDQAKRAYANAIADYNRAQFKLYRALGFAAMDS